MVGASADLLQHPRRNLGNRYRSQARKFAQLAVADSDRFDENMAWAEQNARQAILHDFTDERNWRCLIDIKLILKDGEGLCAVLEDVFVVLGRDADNIEQLKGIDFLLVGDELLDAAFKRDPLDPDEWWTLFTESVQSSELLDDFVQRCKRLDFRDQRANIVYARRLERIRGAGHEALFIDLSKHLLAHRPNNHELWMELGRLHERREEMDEAWSCYDHVQRLQTTQFPRDLFLERITASMLGEQKEPWSIPSVEKRSQFLDQMLSLTQRVSTVEQEAEVELVLTNDEETVNKDEIRLEALIAAGDVSEAFFLARRLASQGEEWAEQWVTKAKNAM